MGAKELRAQCRFLSLHEFAPNDLGGAGDLWGPPDPLSGDASQLLAALSAGGLAAPTVRPFPAVLAR